MSSRRVESLMTTWGGKLNGVDEEQLRQLFVIEEWEYFDSCSEPLSPPTF